MSNIDKSKILLHAWAVEKKGDEYFMSYTHWVYLKEIVQYYDEIVLLSVCKKLKENEDTSFIRIEFSNVFVYELPYSKGYIGAVKHFSKYRKAYKEMKGVTAYYSRYPIPFGWLQKKYGKTAKRIIHYVGDPIDVAKHNPNFSTLKKTALINGFKIENKLYNWACKGAKVFTNGDHIAERLAKHNIKATPLISSTLTEKDFYFEEKNINKNEAKFIYLGYLRKAKGVETIIKAFSVYNKKYPNSKLTIIGAGEFEQTLKMMCKEEHINNVSFLGHIDDRNHINQLLKSHDIFLFGSVSEGSPRVILEAMANGLLIISTPVGSLPKVFEDGKEILFANYNDADDFVSKMNDVANDDMKFNAIRKQSFEKVKNFTIDNFIKKIFNGA